MNKRGLKIEQNALDAFEYFSLHPFGYKQKLEICSFTVFVNTFMNLFMISGKFKLLTLIIL